jgi:GNAT superfamily N-acetyltransferase
VDFRDMTDADLADGLRLSRSSGWNQTLEDWRLLLASGPFRVATLDGTVVASGGAVVYGEALAWICMILVDSDTRGRGFGTRIFDEVASRCASEREKGRLRSVGLDATPAGRAIYRRHGYLDAPGLVRMRLESERPDRPRQGARPMTAADLDVVLERDRQVFGADRGFLLRWALERAPELAFVAIASGRVAGYCFGRHGDHSAHVGPLVAEDRETALDLVGACVANRRRRPLIVDARAEPLWLEALGALGLRVTRSFTRMYLGETRPHGQPELEPLVCGPEFG